MHHTVEDIILRIRPIDAQSRKFTHCYDGTNITVEDIPHLRPETSGDTITDFGVCTVEEIILYSTQTLPKGGTSSHCVPQIFCLCIEWGV
jgi:hypothetical protein